MDKILIETQLEDTSVLARTLREIEKGQKMCGLLKVISIEGNRASLTFEQERSMDWVYFPRKSYLRKVFKSGARLTENIEDEVYNFSLKIDMRKVKAKEINLDKLLFSTLESDIDNLHAYISAHLKTRAKRV